MCSAGGCSLLRIRSNLSTTACHHQSSFFLGKYVCIYVCISMHAICVCLCPNVYVFNVCSNVFCVFQNVFCVLKHMFECVDMYVWVLHLHFWSIISVISCALDCNLHHFFVFVNRILGSKSWINYILRVPAPLKLSVYLIRNLGFIHTTSILNVIYLLVCSQ